MDELERVDLLRQRTGLSYTEARQLLNEAGGDVLEALILHENRTKGGTQKLEAKGSEVLEKIKALVRQGNITHLRVVREGHVLLDIPVTASVVGAALAPQLAGIGVLAAVLTGCRIQFETREGERQEWDLKTGKPVPQEPQGPATGDPAH